MATNPTGPSRARQGGASGASTTKRKGDETTYAAKTTAAKKKSKSTGVEVIESEKVPSTRKPRMSNTQHKTFWDGITAQDDLMLDEERMKKRSPYEYGMVEEKDILTSTAVSSFTHHDQHALS